MKLRTDMIVRQEGPLTLYRGELAEYFVLSAVAGRMTSWWTLYSRQYGLSDDEEIYVVTRVRADRRVRLSAVGHRILARLHGDRSDVIPLLTCLIFESNLDGAMTEFDFGSRR